MIAINDQKKELVITIKTSSPGEQLIWLQRAIANSMRWAANSAKEDRHNEDADTQVILADLLLTLLEY